MPPPPNTKPENVLKRAQELIGVGQSQAALSLLHEHVTSKRTRNNPISSIEPVMLLFVELCVDLRKGKAAKDGLYSYKNTAQNSNVQTIELVLKRFIELAEQKVTEAQAKAEAVQSEQEPSAATANIDDLEASETPESILLSTVSGEQSRDRVDRAIVTPWLKLLWETYRSVLDILKNNARLEIMYGTVAQQAFTFCRNYERRTEFRRLCELLRNHLQNAAKYQSQIHAINLNDPDTLQRHLDTRFQQLKIATELSLWQEAFRSIEDIHMLLNLSRRGAKNSQMATYFEQLSRIFLKSDNYLFHAASYNRYYNLLRASAHALATGQGTKKDNPTVTEADLANCASFVVLSALSIPVISTSRSRGALVDVDENRKAKAQRLTNLLGLSTPPSRVLLFKEIISKGLLKRARPEIRELYNILEVDFSPLLVCKKISPILTQIGSDPEMSTYVHPLQQVILTRLFQQLSQVYESVKLGFVLDLAQFPEPFQVDSATIEKFIMNGCKKGDLAIRINHATNVLTFDSDVFSSARALHPGAPSGSSESSIAVQQLQKTPSDIVRSSLTRLAKTLYITCQYVDPTHNEDQRKGRAIALQRAEAGANKEHMETLDRRATIERKKQAASTAAAQREVEEANRKRQKQQEQQQAEVLRLETEQREREARRLREQQQRVKREEVEKQLDELKRGVKHVDLSDINPDEIDTTQVRLLKLQALEKEKNELGERLRATGKRLDHLERAMRKAEAEKLDVDKEAQYKEDLAEYENEKMRTLKESEERHKADVLLKRRLSRLVGVYEDFRNEIREQRSSDYEKRRKIAQRELEQKKKQRINEFRERKVREQREKEERERQEREEEERKHREAEEAAAREEEKKQKEAELRTRQEEARRRQDEIAARQAQREAEAEARRVERRAQTHAPPSRTFERGGAEPAANPAPLDSTTRTAPRFVGAGGRGPSWRDREAESSAQQSASQSRSEQQAGSVGGTASPSTTVRSGGYVPPHLRGRGPGGPTAPAEGSRSGESMSDSWRASRGQDDLSTGTNPRSNSRYERNASPTNGAGLNDTAGRAFSSNAGEASAQSASFSSTPASAVDGGSGGRYRPGAFSKARAQQSQ